MPNMLVGWGLIMNRYMGFFLFTAISRQTLGLSDLFSCMKPNTCLNLVPRISGWNFKDSSLWDITPWRVKPYNFVLESTHILNGSAKTKSYGWWTSFEYMLVLPTQLLHHTLNLNIGRLLALVLNEGEIWFKILKSFVLPSCHTVHMCVQWSTWPFYQHWSFLQHGGEVWTSVGSYVKVPALYTKFTRKNVHYLHTVKTVVLRTECAGFSRKWGSINFNGQWTCVRSELDYTF